MELLGERKMGKLCRWCLRNHGEHCRYTFLSTSISPANTMSVSSCNCFSKTWAGLKVEECKASMTSVELIQFSWQQMNGANPKLAKRGDEMFGNWLVCRYITSHNFICFSKQPESRCYCLNLQVSCPNHAVRKSEHKNNG